MIADAPPAMSYMNSRIHALKKREITRHVKEKANFTFTHKNLKCKKQYFTKPRYIGNEDCKKNEVKTCTVQ